MNKKLAVVVLSGGLDSATALGLAVHSDADQVVAVTFNYGQRHSVEIEKAMALCEHYGVDQHVIKLPEIFKGGVLTTDAEVPDMRYSDLEDGQMSPAYVPYRNGTLLSMAAAVTDSMIQESDAWDDPFKSALLYAGMHAEDAQGFAYADCTPEFLGAQAASIYIGTYGRVRLHCPFQTMEKHEIVDLGLGLQVPYHLTHSCYRGTEPACGTCATCRARLEAFDRVAATDPIPYENAQGRLF